MEAGSFLVGYLLGLPCMAFAPTAVTLILTLTLTITLTLSPTPTLPLPLTLPLLPGRPGVPRGVAAVPLVVRDARRGDGLRLRDEG